ncbi:enoyl-CoA hydratase-related protein [Yoonia sp.]|uniref:enoyl-CoA hydratase-related protein n=1 Tax=Yoonia sp. TaxID=2212373 RepID=UPI0025FF60FF|nr:enoyl-CoA hydratase-related protein [Yoonia sp.]
MAKGATFRIVNDVGLVHLDAPPVNALGAALCARLWDIFQRVAQDKDIKAVVILAAGRMFSAGADIKELGKSQQAPALSDLCDLIEACKVPVVAAMQGAALGGGAELAMAAHYRIALPQAVIGLPEVTLGLVPGAGGTQRLPRLVGAKNALAMIIGGRAVAAMRAREMGLIDRVVADDLPLNAVAFARQVSGARPTRDGRDMLLDGAGFLRAVDDRRGVVAASGRHAAQRALECIEGALLLPFATGLALEADAFADCLRHPQSQALRHVFLAERQIAPDLLRKTDQGRVVADPAGTAVVAALRMAWQRALEALRQQGISETMIDGALVAHGFGCGPYGGRDAVRGPQSADVQFRMLAAVVAEGARLVAAGAVARAADIDALAVHALGFPRGRGGPMKAAQLAGLLTLTEQMKLWAADDPIWQAPPFLRHAALVSGGFDVVTP